MSQPEMKLPPPPGIDRISALPDEMLIYILSFLPTKSAFTTTVLSKRWTSLCHFLTALHFDEEGTQDQENCLRFFRMVDTVLLSTRFHHRPIETFFLMVRSELCNYHGFKVDEWVEAAKQRGVENLHLSSPTCLWSLSPSFFNSRTLVVLKLSGWFCIKKFGSVDLPRLKTLHLLDTWIEEREDFMKLLSGCPNLVDLYARVKFFDDGYNYTTAFKTLPKLEKACITTLDVPFSVIYNVQFLRIEKMECMCSNKYIESYYRKMPVFRNLISIELCFYIFHGWDRVVEVLLHCPKLQTLVIEKRVQFGKEKWAYTEPVPECVSLHLRTCSIQNCMYGDFEFAAYIMQNARLLQVMTLHSAPLTEESEKYRYLKQLSRRPRIYPTCKLCWDTKEINQRKHEKLSAT